MLRHSYIDGLGRPVPPPPPLSRDESVRRGIERVESAAGHLDAPERSRVIMDIEAVLGVRGITRAEAHVACGLRPGALYDCSLTTDQLRGGLAVLRGLPMP